MKNSYLRAYWFFSNAFIYCISIALAIGLYILPSDIDRPTFSIIIVSILLTFLVAVYQTFKIIGWMREGKL